jgi:hypothetical protein
MSMNDEEYKRFLSALAAKHVRRTLSPEEQERLQIALRELTQASRQVQDLREEVPEKRRNGSSEMRELADRLKGIPVYEGFHVMERIGISEALDEATDAVFANLRRSAIPDEDVQLLYRAGIANPELEITIMIEYARRNIRISRGSLLDAVRKASDLSPEMADRLQRASKEFDQPSAAAVQPKKRKLLNGIGKILGGAIAGTGNVLLLAGTVIAPNPATGYGAIASSALAVAGILQGAGDLRGE